MYSQTTWRETNLRTVANTLEYPANLRTTSSSSRSATERKVVVVTVHRSQQFFIANKVFSVIPIIYLRDDLKASLKGF